MTEDNHSQSEFESDFGAWSYVSIPPPDDLKPFVIEFWEIQGVAQYGYEKIIPSGTVDFMVNLGAPQILLQDPYDPSPDLIVDSWMSGMRDRPLYAGPAKNTGVFRTHFVAARLKPQGIPGIFGIDAVEFLNSVVKGDDFLGLGHRELKDQLLEATSSSMRISILVDFLRRTLASNGRATSNLADWAFDKTLTTKGDIRVESLYESLGVSRKHLVSLYRQSIGISPKKFARLTRFRSVLERLDDPKQSQWTEVALAAGYFDHAHLIRDFKLFAGESPESFLKNRSPDGESVNYTDRPLADE